MSRRPRLLGGLDVIIESLAMRYEYDDVGRIVGAFGDGINPRFVLGRSREGCIWRFAATLAPEQIRSIARLAGREPGLSGPPGVSPPERLAMIQRLLSLEEAESGTTHEILTIDGTASAELWTLR